MRKTLGIVGLAGVVAIAVAQANGGTILGNFAKALNSAQSLSSTYTIQVIGSAPENFSVSLKKPNLARIETPHAMIVADGKNITTFDKAAKTYHKKPQTEADLKALFASDELNLFAGFFSQDAYKAAAVKALGERNRKGQNVQTVEASIDTAGRKKITYFVSSDNIARAAQFDLNDPSGKMTYIVDAKTLELDGVAPEDAFAFKAPDGSREVTAEELESDRWYTNLEEARQVAARTNKLILVDFYADW